MKFVDSTLIHVKAGRGGDGIVSFRSAKGRPKMGPDGGDGGWGGDVYLVASKQLNTLSSVRYKQIYKAGDGARGGSNGKTGARGEDRVIPVPLGTIVIDDATGKQLGEILKEGERLQVAKGGTRGLGNIHWVSSTHQAPHEFKPGGPGEELTLRLELKLLADVGLAGFPNAGKSTLLSRLSAARPKVADYPFTTLVPNLGVVDVEDVTGEWGASLVLADVPGLIEGASEGRGLGHAFLRHLERTSVIAYVLDGFDPERSSEDAYRILRDEMKSFSPALAKKQSLIVINKLDLVPVQEERETVSNLIAPFEEEGLEVFTISAVGGTGLDQLKRRLHELVREQKALEPDSQAPTVDQKAGTESAWKELEDRFRSAAAEASGALDEDKKPQGGDHDR